MNCTMKKTIFTAVLMLLLPLFINAQDNINNDINNSPNKTTYTMQELNSKVLDGYGSNHTFIKLQNGRYVPVNALDIKKISETQIDSDVILIFAIIGAVLVALILLRSVK